MAIRVGINGFGRVGRALAKQMLADDRFEVVGINDLADLGDLAYLLKYDSIYGWYASKVDHAPSTLVVDGEEIPFSAEADPARLPWRELGASIVIEASGAFRPRAKAALHLEAGAERVIISAPSPDADGTFVLGVNDELFDAEQHRVVSMASCTTNCLAPVARVLNSEFGIEHLMITTVHAYTSSQSLMDRPTRKRRRGRAAALSIVPTTTGAAAATALVLPELEGKMAGLAMRVPVPDGSITDIVATLDRSASAASVNEALIVAASSSPLQGILRVSDEALVSRDIIGDPHSSIVDAESTLVVGEKMVKVLSWYDNEWGYAARLKDFAGMIGERIS